MKIAHLSDFHILALEGVPLHRLMLGKRLTGYVNLRLRRAHHHRTDLARALMQDIASQQIDHVAITGDLSNLALETEFAAARAMLETELKFSPKDITMVPGNHDRYTRGAHRTQRFESFFEPYLHSDIDWPMARPGHFPVVKLRGPLAIVGLNTAVARLPFVASGEVGTRQLRALEQILEHPEVQQRTLVLLLHHPAVNPRWRLKTYLEGLRDAPELHEILMRCGRGVVLHGHLHRRLAQRLPTQRGELWVIGAGSASLHAEHHTRTAGYNVYDFSEAGTLQNVYVRMLREGDRFETLPFPTPIHSF